MLKLLHIKNFALIDSLDIEFDAGFSVITGETGAGKSDFLGDGMSVHFTPLNPVIAYRKFTGFSGVKWTLIPSPSMSAASPMSTPFVPLASVNVAVAASPVGVISASTTDSKTAVLFLGPFLTLPFILTTSSFCSMPRDMVSSRAAPVFSPMM